MNCENDFHIVMPKVIPIRFTYRYWKIRIELKIGDLISFGSNGNGFLLKPTFMDNARKKIVQLISELFIEYPRRGRLKSA